MYKIQTLNKISAVGLEDFPRDDYETASSLNNPDAILVRSADMHKMELSGTVKAVARAGAGVNNIPIDELTKKGIVVFTPTQENELLDFMQNDPVYAKYYDEVVILLETGLRKIGRAHV